MHIINVTIQSLSYDLMKYIVVLLLISSVLCTSPLIDAFLRGLRRQPLNEPQTVAHVDLKRYAGTWYEQARIPFYWDQGCSRTNATYSLNADGTVKVDNQCERAGKLSRSVGVAKPVDRSNSKLKVQFPQSFGAAGDYWVVRLSEEYNLAVVSGPTRKFLWILYRGKVLPKYIYDMVVRDLEIDGYPVGQLVKTQQ